MGQQCTHALFQVIHLVFDNHFAIEVSSFLQRGALCSAIKHRKRLHSRRLASTRKCMSQKRQSRTPPECSQIYIKIVLLAYVPRPPTFTCFVPFPHQWRIQGQLVRTPLSPIRPHPYSQLNRHRPPMHVQQCDLVSIHVAFLIAGK